MKDWFVSISQEKKLFQNLIESFSSIPSVQNANQPENPQYFRNSDWFYLICVTLA